jgi:hypothetical protein
MATLVVVVVEQVLWVETATVHLLQVLEEQE